MHSESATFYMYNSLNHSSAITHNESFEEQHHVESFEEQHHNESFEEQRHNESFEEQHDESFEDQHHDESFEDQHCGHGDRDYGTEQETLPLAGNIRPQRERQRPKMLTYDSLGQPTIRQAVMDSIEVSKTAPLFQVLWRPWLPRNIYVKPIC